MLTQADIRLIMDRIGRKVVVPATDDFKFEIITARSRGGYSDDPQVGALQAKLSIMLEAKARIGAE